MNKTTKPSRTYYKELGALITIIFVGFLYYCNLKWELDDLSYVREPDLFMKPVIVVPEPSLEEKIMEYFPRSWKTMIAVAHAESRMSMDAIGYNCYYEGYYGTIKTSTGLKKIPIITNETALSKKTDGVISVACLKKDRSFAWSVDCFLLQKNYVGRKTCPEGVSLDQHLKEVSDLSKQQGLKAWAAYNNGSYKQHLTVK